MIGRKKFFACALALFLALSAMPASAGVRGGAMFVGPDWERWKAAWPAMAADLTRMSIAPGADETQLNFAWYSRRGEKPTLLLGPSGGEMREFVGTSGPVPPETTGGVAYQYNHVTATGLRPDTEYHYSKGGEAPRTVRTPRRDEVNILFVSDPQIGASLGQRLEGEKLVNPEGAANTAARSDSFAWDRTLSIAAARHPGLNLIVCAGDQVSKSVRNREEEYAGCLAPALLGRLPMATAIGNHDSTKPDWSWHFNNPNLTGLGMTRAGGDYFFLCGPALFVVLNTNNLNVAEHARILERAVRSHPEARWRVVVIHHDIYGAGFDHSGGDGMVLRTQLTPLFDRYAVDAVLQGHDHSYFRSRILRGDGRPHAAWGLSGWKGVPKGAVSLVLKPKTQAQQDALNRFREDSRCWVIADDGGDTATDPSGTLYAMMNSASGSKFYMLMKERQEYAAVQSQNDLPCYAVIRVTRDAFALETFQILNSGAPERIDAFTIRKTRQ